MKCPQLLFASLFALTLIACSSSDQSASGTAPGKSATAPPPAAATTASTTPPATASTPAPAAAGSSAANDAQDDAVIAKVSASIARNHLTSLKPECIDYLVGDRTAEGVDVDVHEKHDEHCGGDPGVSPRMFSFHVDAAGKLTTDARDIADGDMKPID
ncbi:hypothetical protein [Dyella sp.]|uniref:hypothetical protein n=1 Tax=Dyella sp. TaxID=1869338 RepID=UPI002ED40DB9